MWNQGSGRGRCTDAELEALAMHVVTKRVPGRESHGIPLQIAVRVAFCGHPATAAAAESGLVRRWYAAGNLLVEVDVRVAGFLESFGR